MKPEENNPGGGKSQPDSLHQSHVINAGGESIKNWPESKWNTDANRLEEKLTVTPPPQELLGLFFSWSVPLRHHGNSISF